MSYKLILILVLATCTFALKPSLANALRNQVIVDFKNNIIPVISKQIEHITIPDIHTSQSGFDIDVTNIHVDVRPIDPNNIGIVFVPGTSILRFSSRGISLHGGAHIRVKWSFIQKSMDADIDISGAGFDCQVSLFSNGGKPNIRVDSLSVAPGSISIHLHGDIIVKIIEFIVDLLKGRLTNEIVNQLQSKLPPMITQQVNDKLNHIPTDIEVGYDLALKYGFPYAPFVRNDYLFTAINAHIHPKNNPNPPPYEPSDLPEFDPNNPKGIQFFFSDYVVKSSLDASYAVGLLTFSFEKDILEHHIRMDCKATSVPSFGFHSSIDVSVASECNVVFDNDNNNHFVLVSEVHVNLQEYIRRAVIYFSVDIAKFEKLEYRQDHPVDIEWFKDGVNTVLDAIKEVVNGIMGAKGIPLPTIPGIDYTDTVQYIKQGYMEICTTPVFHF